MAKSEKVSVVLSSTFYKSRQLQSPAVQSQLRSNFAIPC